MSDVYTRGLTEARHNYAQAWVDGTGKSLEAVEFTTGFVRERVTAMQKVIERVLGVEKENKHLRAKVRSLEARIEDLINGDF